MSNISNELSRIENAKTTLKAALNGKGAGIPDSALLSDFSDYVGNIVGSASCCLTEDDALAILDETGVAKAIVDENGIIVTDADNRILIY